MTVTTISPLTPERGTIEDLRCAEALRDAGDRAAVRARVEEVGGLDERELGLGETAQNRLVRDGRFLGAPAASEQAAPAALAATRVERNGGDRRAPLAQPAVIEGDLGAERADVDVLAAVRRKADRVLAHQQRALADCARPRCGVSRHAHRFDRSRRSPELSTARHAPSSAICFLHMYRRGRGGHRRARRPDRALPGRRDCSC